MAGIKQPIQDILSKLSQIQVTNQDGMTVGLYSRLWNNQLRDTEDGKSYSWPMPAAFVEIISPVVYEVIGLGLRSADLGIRIHLIHEFYNQDSTFEQDLSILDLRDKIISELSGYCPTAMGQLNCISEVNDSDHDNLVHYQLEFVAHYIDSKSSKIESMNEEVIADLDVLVQEFTPTPVEQETDYFIIPKKQ